MSNTRLWLRALTRRARGSLQRRLSDPTPADCHGRPRLYPGGDWVDQVSPDQARIDAWVGPRLRDGDRVLFVGIGESALARAAPAIVLDGVTLSDAEAAIAKNTPTRARYTVTVADKHTLPFSGPYDWILDNNPTSFACCRTHANALLDAYAAALSPTGSFVTDRVGLHFAEGSGFGMRWAKWEAAARARGCVAVRETADTWVWRRG